MSSIARLIEKEFSYLKKELSNVETAAPLPTTNVKQAAARLTKLAKVMPDVDDISALVSWYSGYYMGLNKKNNKSNWDKTRIARLIKAFVAINKVYPVKPVKTLYRVTRLNISPRIDTIEKVQAITKLVTPNIGVQSWTTDPKAALKFFNDIHRFHATRKATRDCSWAIIQSDIPDSLQMSSLSTLYQVYVDLYTCAVNKAMPEPYLEASYRIYDKASIAVHLREFSKAWINKQQEIVVRTKGKFQIKVVKVLTLRTKFDWEIRKEQRKLKSRRS